MAKIKLDLTQFKASGVYTLEFDASESIILNTQTTRLVVGFSRKGPFNSPVYLPDVKTARRIFGEIDPFLESRGSFFHRSLLTCLEIGPVFGLNLLPLNNQPITQGGDAVEYRSYSVDTSESNGVVTRALYSSFYNTQRFWYPDDTNLVAVANSSALNNGKLLHLVNLSQSPASVIIRKTRVNGFDITARDWYGQSGETLPEYVHEFDYIADYFVEVIIVAGKWTDYKKLSTDPVYSKYFNERGIIKGQLNLFLSSEEINTIARFTGCLIPDFVDGNGVNHSLDIVVNNSVATTGVFLAFNKEALTDYETSTSKYDVIGHNLAKAAFDGDPATNLNYLDMLSYKTNVKEQFDYTEEFGVTTTGDFESTTYTAESTGDFYTESYRSRGIFGAFKNTLVLKRPLSTSVSKYNDYQFIKNNLNVAGSLIRLASGAWGKVETKNETLDSDGNTVLKITYSHPNKSDELTMTPVDILGSSFTTTQTVALTSGDDTFTPGSITQLRVNQPVYATTGIPSDTYITNINTSTGVVTISNDAGASGNVLLTFGASVTIEGDVTASIAEGDEILIKNKIDTTTFYVNTNLEGVDFSAVQLNGDGNTIVPVDNMIELQDMSLNPSYYSCTFGAVEYPDVSGDEITIAYTPDIFRFQGYEIEITAGLIDGDPYIIGDTYWGVSFDPYTASASGYAAELKHVGINPVNSKKVFRVMGTYTDVTDSAYAHTLTLNDSVDMTDVFDGGAFIALDESGEPNNDNVASVKVAVNASPTIINSTVYRFVCYPYSQPYLDFESGFLANGDKYYYDGNDFFYLRYNKTTDTNGISILEIKAYEDATYNTVVSSTSTNQFSDELNYVKAALSPNSVGDVTLYPFADSFSESFEIQSWNATKSEVDVNVDDAVGLEVGQYLVSYTTDETGADVWRLTKIIKKRKVFDELTSLFRFRYTVNQSVYIENEFEPSMAKTVTRYKSIDDFATQYDFTSMSGFKLTSYHLPGDRTNKQSQMEKIYEVLKNTNLFEALQSRDVIQFRYIIDTFDGGLQPNNYPKSILSELAKDRLKCLALLNPPSARQFEASTDPRFTDEPDPAGGNPRPLLNTAYIASGGNQTLGPSFSYSLPDEQNGSKHAAFFFPYLILRDGTKNITIPPAAHVSNNFVLKFINGFPYSIVAGPRRGVLSDSRLVGPEIDLSDTDRELLEPFGLNPIVKRARIGTMIYGNQTAYQKVPSALNNVHVRDLLITIEEGVEDILSRYIFEFNDATTRLEIKSIVDTFLDGVRSAGGIYNFFTQMDDTNNPPEIIDQNKAIIDIAVEPARGIQIAISRITVTKTGGANASAFQFV
jgi:hypothetical protein